MKINGKTIYRLLRKIYRKRVILSTFCFYAFTVVVLLQLHLKYTKEHFENSLGFAPRLSRSIKSLPDVMKPEIRLASELSEKLNQSGAPSGGNSSLSRQKEEHKRYPDVLIIENIRFPKQEIKPVDGKWQNVTSDGKLYVFSAFFEMADGRPTVRILGINGNTYLPKPYCQFQYKDGSHVTVKGRVSMLPDHHEKQFRAIFFFCSLPDDRHVVAVSVISQKQPELLNSLQVLHNDKEMRTFTACLSPLHFNVSKHFELIQWFELNKLLGVEFFIVYNQSTVGETDAILSHYVKEGWINVVQWDIPTDAVHYHGQMAMINDCLFRNQKVSRYILNTDSDEYIVPRRGLRTLADLMKELPQNVCEYNVRSSFLVSDSEKVYEGKEAAKELHLDVLLKLSRREYIFPKNVRSKYIANTTCIDTAGIHYSWSYKNKKPEYQKYHVLSRDALVLHFRNKPLAKDGQEVEEKAIYKFQNELINNVKRRWKKINREAKVFLK